MLWKTELYIACFFTGVTLTTSNLAEDNSSIPCRNNADCEPTTSSSICYYGYCVCDYGYYNFTDTHLTNVSSTKCLPCPDVGESCAKAECCMSYSSSTNVLCQSGVCVAECYFCWATTPDQRYRFEQIAQFILGSALFFTLAILFILFWKACTRRRSDDENMPHCESFISINSIQRLVLLRLQDRPPPYSTFTQNQNTKSNSNQNNQRQQIVYEEPPPYASVVSPGNNDGIINHSFYIGEQPTSQMSGDSSNSDQQIENAYKPEIHI